MTKLLIEIPDTQDARLLTEFARRLNATVIEIESDIDEKRFWEALALNSLERAYVDDEPDYEN